MTCTGQLNAQFRHQESNPSCPVIISTAYYRCFTAPTMHNSPKPEIQIMTAVGKSRRLEIWKSGYNPDREIAIDETIIPFKGRTGMKVYKPNKPHKWGLNCWNVAESCTGYVWNAELYQGKRNNQTEVGMYKALVIRMCQPLFDRGHHIYMDNLFSSLELYIELAAHQIGACGTLRVKRIGTPDAIKATKMKKGDDLRSVHDGELLFLSWYDKRQVNIMTSVHNASTYSPKMFEHEDKMSHVTLTSQWLLNATRSTWGGVDRADQGMWYMLNIYKTLKWWKKVFVYLLVVYRQPKIMN